MTIAFEHPFTVPASAIDENGHANNVEYVRWMQEAARAHADHCGGSVVARELGAAWVVRSHQIEYLRPLVEGDLVVVSTWVESFRRVASLRQYQFKCLGELVARGETKWVLIDLLSGRLRTLPEELIRCFRKGTSESR